MTRRRTRKAREDREPAAPAPSRRERLRSYLPIVQFVVVTTVTLIALFWLLHRRAVVVGFVDPWTDFVAACSRLLLSAIGIDVSGSGAMISSPEFSVSIKNVCNGLEVTAIFFATVLGFPAPWKHKLIGLAVGYPAVFLINVVRIIVLFVIGARIPTAFEDVHYYYAQAFVILATVAVWLVWVSMYGRPKTRPDIPG